MAGELPLDPLEAPRHMLVASHGPVRREDIEDAVGEDYRGDVARHGVELDTPLVWETEAAQRAVALDIEEPLRAVARARGDRVEEMVDEAVDGDIPRGADAAELAGIGGEVEIGDGQGGAGVGIEVFHNIYDKGVGECFYAAKLRHETGGNSAIMHTCEGEF